MLIAKITFLILVALLVFLLGRAKPDSRADRKSPAWTGLSGKTQAPNRLHGRITCSLLPVYLHRELELPRIVSRGGLPRSSPQLVHGRNVEAIGDIEHIYDKVHVHALPEIETARDPKVIENRPRLKSRIPAQGPVQRKQGRRSAGRKHCVARFLEEAGGRKPGGHRWPARSRGSPGWDNIWPSGVRRELKVVRVAGQDVERPSGRHVDDGSKCPITKQLAAEAAATQPAALIDPTEHKAMPLIKKRI